MEKYKLTFTPQSRNDLILVHISAEEIAGHFFDKGWQGHYNTICPIRWEDAKQDFINLLSEEKVQQLNEKIKVDAPDTIEAECRLSDLTAITSKYYETPTVR